MSEQQKRYRIWWSPMGAPNGHAIITASSQTEAKACAREEMHGSCGAYGADEVKNDA